MTERIVISLGADGRVSAHTEGIMGEKCLGAVPLLEDLLDAVAVDSAYTSDFHQITGATHDATRTQAQQEQAT